VSVVREDSLALLASVSVGLRPVALAIDEAAHRIYVANSDGDSVCVIDGDTAQVVATIPLAMHPQAIVADPARGRAYVASSSTDSVYAISGGQVVDELPVGRHPAALALDGERQLLYVANRAEGTCSVINLAGDGPLRRVDVGGNPQAIALDPVMGRAYVGDAVVGLGALDVQGRLGLSASAMGMDIIPQRLLADPQRGRLYAIASNGVPGSNGGSIVYALDGADHAHSGLRFGALGATALALDPASGTLFSASERMGYGRVQAQDVETGEDIVAALETWKRPRSLAYNTATGHLFVGLYSGPRRDVDFAPEILVLDGELRQVASVAFSGDPGALAVDAINNLVYVCDGKSGRVSLIQDVELTAP
jgi:YVTN family beta-propeller protein